MLESGFESISINLRLTSVYYSISINFMQPNSNVYKSSMLNFLTSDGIDLNRSPFLIQTLTVLNNGFKLMFMIGQSVGKIPRSKNLGSPKWEPSRPFGGLLLLRWELSTAWNISLVGKFTISSEIQTASGALFAPSLASGVPLGRLLNYTWESSPAKW